MAANQGCHTPAALKNPSPHAIAGVTGVHVAAVSSGDNHPYPGVNNTVRWTALAGSCSYPFTILGQNETWAGDKGVTNNKLFFYMRCGWGTSAWIVTLRNCAQSAKPHS